ncbi:flagellar transcriptional activator FlhC [Pseudomonas nitritireducens]|uniref:Flagellar transcriptional activator FlhC n=1 Tax=Pseudomonas nitroreducens TaxID=46680 RepID=A0A7W7KMA0_PSENT|nr:FlhC family transcriptional regulator [Pseudomonas nitritireducens]MBB4865406.1 flagellar transcriptional activator FlhC [Pseudomonas nitritireducens]
MDDSQKSLLEQHAQVTRAINLLGAGARIQVVLQETEVSKHKLLKLYREISGVSPPKGQIPYSKHWFLKWNQNIHASLFYNYYLAISAQNREMDKMDVFMSAIRLYHSQVGFEDGDVPLVVTRAWMLLKFMETDQLRMTRCTSCSGWFVTDFVQHSNYACVICQPPARVGRSQDGFEAEDEGDELLEEDSD